MNSLSKVLIGKILFTMFAWCLPLLLVDTGLPKSLGFVVPDMTLYIQLLGMAYASLVVGYVFGLQTSLRGDYPANVVWVGIVSNGGAFSILVLNAVLGTWSSWETCPRLFMWFSLVTTGVITAGLIGYGVCGERPQSGAGPGRITGSTSH